MLLLTGIVINYQSMGVLRIQSIFQLLRAFQFVHFRSFGVRRRPCLFRGRTPKGWKANKSCLSISAAFCLPSPSRGVRKQVSVPLKKNGDPFSIVRRVLQRLFLDSSNFSYSFPPRGIRKQVSAPINQKMEITYLQCATNAFLKMSF